jgi:aspartate aminotransferase-like enzyme
MFQAGDYVFKRAETSQELEQIHSLNYRTFVTEIPQHVDPGDGRLVDKFHDKNAYFIVLFEGRVIGMVSTHDQPPYSVADRLKDPSILQRPGTRPLEVRLLAIEPGKRNTPITVGLLMLVYEHARQNGYTHLYISGVEDRLPMYEELGFEPLGPAVRCGQARFVPKVTTPAQIAKANQRRMQLWQKHLERVSGRPARMVCLLPGPVMISPAVHEAFHQAPIYHRGPEFIALFQRVRGILGEMVGDRDVALMNGSGTLANEVVAATLAADPAEQTTRRSGTRGVMLVNGEFGQRLARQAARFGLRPRILNWPWGQPWNLNEVADALAAEPAGSWVWGVHQESSTGVLNDLPGLVRLARGHGIRVCMDCISSLGAVPIDLTEVYLASGASGKALGSYAGTAIVFAQARSLTHLDTSCVPSYLDLPASLATVGPRYTFPSPNMLALEAAVSEYRSKFLAESRYAHYADLGFYIRQQLRQVGFEPLADEACAAPVVTTFAPPGNESSAAFVARCREWGFEIGGQSGYLAERRLVQIATMGSLSHGDCAPLFDRLRRWLAKESAFRSDRSGMHRAALVTG